MKKILRDWFSGPDNASFELWRFLQFAGFFIGNGWQGYSILNGAEFDPTAYFQAVGAYILLSGAGTAVKDFGSASAAKAAK